MPFALKPCKVPLYILCYKNNWKPSKNFGFFGRTCISLSLSLSLSPLTTNCAQVVENGNCTSALHTTSALNYFLYTLKLRHEQCRRKKKWNGYNHRITVCVCRPIQDEMMSSCIELLLFVPLTLRSCLEWAGSHTAPWVGNPELSKVHHHAPLHQQKRCCPQDLPKWSQWYFCHFEIFISQ